MSPESGDFGFSPADLGFEEPAKERKQNLWAGTGPKPFAAEAAPKSSSRPDSLSIYEKRAERAKQPMSCSISIDRAALDAVKERIHRDVPANMRDYMSEQRQNVEQIIERIKKLPDGLSFKPGITLIVGDNGAGKSTLARAIFYAMRIESEVQDGESRDVATKDVLDPRGQNLPVTRGELFDLKRSGVAVDIAPALKLEQTGITELVRYQDFTTITGGARSVDSSEMASPEARDRFYAEWEPTFSNRQTIDRELKEMYVGRKPKMVSFEDEPEIGMSPRRQKGLEQEIASRAKEGSIQIVPTNSVVLYDNPDLPRIDLDYPERGVFYPRDYPNE